MKNLITCLTVCVVSGAALADTWTVDDDGKADFDNIQAAIDAANDGDEIVVMPGTYTSMQTGHVVNLLGKAVTLRSSAPNDPDVVAATIIDGQNARRGIACFNNETFKTIISGFTITDGHAEEFPYDGDTWGLLDESGGGMVMYMSSPTITNCIFSNNAAPSESIAFGGGMYLDGSSPTVTNCTFKNNSANGCGGGLSLRYNSDLTLTDCTFEGNQAGTFDNLDSWWEGGGIHNSESSVTITNCIFKSNICNGAGAALINAGSACQAIVTGCTFTQNRNNYVGSAMSNDYCSPTITNCTFDQNIKSAIYNYGQGANPIVTACIFTNNVGQTKGGAMSNRQGAWPIITNCTFTGNSASTGSGGAIWNGYDSFCTVIDCIIENNSASHDGGGIYSRSGDTADDISFATISGSNLCSNTPDQIYGDFNDVGDNLISSFCLAEGACCVTSGCDIVEETMCINFGGTWTEAGSCNDCVAPPETCAGDINADGVVDVNDLLIMIAAWGVCP